MRVHQGGAVLTFPLAPHLKVDPRGQWDVDHLNLVLHPTGYTADGAQPKDLEARWRAAPTDAVELRRGKAEESVLLDPELIPIGPSQLLADYRATLRGHLRELIVYPEHGPPGIVIHAFARTPWRYLALVHGLVRRIDPDLTVRFAPLRHHRNSPWRLGCDLWEVVRIKPTSPPPGYDVVTIEHEVEVENPPIPALDVDIEELEVEDPEPLPRRRPPLREGL